MLQQLALVQILSAISVEAHINTRAETWLKGRFWSVIERLNVDAKWLFLPKILGLPGFGPALNHIKDSTDSYREDPTRSLQAAEGEIRRFDDPEGFAKKLDLSFESGERSLVRTTPSDCPPGDTR